MNRLPYILLLSAITVIGFTMFQYNDLGKISFHFAAYSFDTNLVIFSAVLLSAFFLFFMLLKSWQFINNFFVHLIGKRKNRLTEKARLSLTQGLIEYAEGRFEQAEKILLQQIEHSDNCLLAYLSAARAAQQLGAHDRRDDYLRKAHLNAPGADIAIGLTKAELQLAHDQNEQALATLTQLNKTSENHIYVLTLLANTYKHLQDWDNLKDILPALKKHGKLSTESFLSFEIIVCNGQLSKLAKNQSPTQLEVFWKNTAHHLKILPIVIEHYIKQLVLVDALNEAEETLRLYLNKNWEESSIILYAELEAGADADSKQLGKQLGKQLETAENWLKDHQHNAWLLLALGKICASLSLWGKAKNYLEASIAINPIPENYLILAQLLEEHMSDSAAAQEYYRQGLHLLAGEHNTEMLKRSTSSLELVVPPLKIVKT
ncbi:hypothetical protein MNBD_GAMMA06-516 [hydrothermal vent metagenome]|uniref:HemY N-terminal domain-containing protein n=1 Tax=hydrothermal vent metagenome TaxID=652676 RepID=A0A3B0WU47_9ZZZZ